MSHQWSTVCWGKSVRLFDGHEVQQCKLEAVSARERKRDVTLPELERDGVYVCGKFSVDLVFGRCSEMASERERKEERRS